MKKEEANLKNRLREGGQKEEKGGFLYCDLDFLHVPDDSSFHAFLPSLVITDSWGTSHN